MIFGLSYRDRQFYTTFIIPPQRIVRIIAQMRDLSRANFQMELELADINELVDQVLELTYKRCRRAENRSEVEPAPDLPPIPVVSDQIKQVFLNLILNAADAMPDRGELRMRTSLVAEQGMVRIHCVATAVSGENQVRPRRRDFKAARLQKSLESDKVLDWGQRCSHCRGMQALAGPCGRGDG